MIGVFAVLGALLLALWCGFLYSIRDRNAIQQVSPNCWWALHLRGGKVRNILIPREKDPRAYIGLWQSMSGLEVEYAVNLEERDLVVRF